MPSSKSSQESSALLNSSLKYLGLGALARQPEKNPAAAAEEGNATADNAPTTSAATAGPSRFKWTSVRRMTGTGVGGSEEKADADEDDQHIRFTIGGVGRRMTKEDFIKEVQKLDANTRKDVAEASTASRPVKEVAKRNPSYIQPGMNKPTVPRIVETRDEGEAPPPPMTKKRTEAASTAATGPPRGRPTVKKEQQTSEEHMETPVERRRRLAVLASSQRERESAPGGSGGGGSGSGDAGETAAERRRREAALGVGESDSASDSEDEGGERVPPERRGIRFAEPSRR